MTATFIGLLLRGWLSDRRSDRDVSLIDDRVHG
jgi:hypothetical protein